MSRFYKKDSTCSRAIVITLCLQTLLCNGSSSSQSGVVNAKSISRPVLCYGTALAVESSFNPEIPRFVINYHSHAEKRQDILIRRYSFVSNGSKYLFNLTIKASKGQIYLVISCANVCTLMYVLYNASDACK